MNNRQALKAFFEEKQLEDRVFAVEHNDKIHLIDSAFVQDVIVNHTPAHEVKQIRSKIVQIDFCNGDVNHFLEHLATAYVRTNY